MRRVLQSFSITAFLSVTLLIIWGMGSVSVAQVLLKNDTPLEVQFSQGITERNETSIRIGLSDFDTILSAEYVLRNDEWETFDNSIGEKNYFVSDARYGTAPGRVQLKNLPYQTFFAASIQNDSEFSFDNLVLAFDFLYNFFEHDNTYNFELFFKVNDGDWGLLPGGQFDKSSMQSLEDSWRTFSLHLNINDIYLRPSDTIHIIWTIDEMNQVNDRIPLALQRMEIFPERVEPSSLARGDLIITEILPSSDVNGSEFEYVEIYNPGETSVSLKGVELITESGSRVIQKEVYIEPYDFIVISNVDLSSLESVNNSYYYSGSITNSDGGRVELEREGELIASATYKPTKSGVAIELNRVSEAFDGYSSMQDFEESQETYFQDLFGSPGVDGNTNLMFKKSLVRSGLYILSVPGILIPNLNRHRTLEFYSLDGTKLEISNIPPQKPILVEKTGDEPVTLFAELVGQNRNSDDSARLTDKSHLLSIPVYRDGRRVFKQQKENYLQAFPVTQIWDTAENKFDLVLNEMVKTDYWSPIMAHESVSELIEGSDNQVRSPIPDRYIEIGVLPESSDNSALSDVAMIGFMDVPTQYENLRFDLPKMILRESNPNRNRSSQHLLYLTSTLSDESFNSFTHLPQQIAKEYELGLGHSITEDAGGAILKWKLSEKLPDDWVITIEDTFTGTVIDLKEENEYRFRYTKSEESNMIDDLDSPEISSINPGGRPRFIVNVKPYESFTSTSEEEEVPNSIELRPNYPNPFNPSTNINFFLPDERNVRVGIYNIVGQQVALLLDDVVQQGEHSLLWDATNKPSGIYIVQLETGNRIFTRKITLIK